MEWLLGNECNKDILTENVRDDMLDQAAEAQKLYEEFRCLLIQNALIKTNQLVAELKNKIKLGPGGAYWDARLDKDDWQSIKAATENTLVTLKRADTIKQVFSVDQAPESKTRIPRETSHIICQSCTRHLVCI